MLVRSSIPLESRRERVTMRKSRGRAFFIFAVVVLTSLSQAQWLRFHGDSRNTGVYPGGQGRIGEPSVLWTYPIKENLFSSPAIADVDLDGLPEVVIGSGVDTLYALNGEDGSVLWRYVSGSALVYSSPMIGDIDGDQKPEVVCASYGSLRALDGESGGLLWQVPVNGGPGVSPCLADVNGDGVLEVVFAGSAGTIVFQGGDGTMIWTLDGYTAESYGSTVSEDVDADGSAEVIAFTLDPVPSHSLLHGEDGTVLWTTPLPIVSGMILTPAPAFADLDADGTPEIVGACGARHLYALNALDGSLLWSVNESSNLYAAPVVADIDGNDTLEIFQACLNTKKLKAYSCTGELLWTSTTGYLPGATSAAGDIDGDGVVELIQCSTNGTSSAVQIFDGATGEEEWSQEITGSVSASAAIGDLDGDGYFDFIYCVDYSEICAMSTMAEGVDPSPACQDYSLAISPNPAPGTAAVSFFLAEAGGTRVDILDVTGRTVAVLNDCYLPQGEGVIQWEGTGADGGPVPAGVYTCRISTGTGMEAERFCILR